MVAVGLFYLLACFSHRSVSISRHDESVICNLGRTFSYIQFWALGRELYQATSVLFPLILILVRNDATDSAFVEVDPH